MRALRRLGWWTVASLAFAPQVAFGAGPAKAPTAEPAAAAPAAAPAPPAVAPPSPELLAQAKERFDRGNHLFNEGEYKLALVEFEKAYALIPAYQVLYNIGQVNFQLNNHSAALNALERYLADGGAEISEARRKQATKDIALLRTRVVTFSVESNVDGAEVIVDDRALGVTPLKGVFIDGGYHRVTLTKEGYTSAVRTVTYGGGDRGELRIELVPVPQQDARPAEKSTPPIWIPWTVTGAFALATGITGVLAISNSQDLESARTSPPSPTDTTGDGKRREIDDAHTATQTMATVSTVLFGATVIAAGVSTYLTFKWRKSDSSPKVQTGFGPGAVMLNGTF